MKRSSICNVSLLRSLVGCTMYMSMLHIQIYIWHTCQVLVSLQGRFSVGRGSMVVWSAIAKPGDLTVKTRMASCTVTYRLQDDMVCGPTGRDCVEGSIGRDFNCSVTCEGIYADVKILALVNEYNAFKKRNVRHFRFNSIAEATNKAMERQAKKVSWPCTICIIALSPD